MYNGVRNRLTHKKRRNENEKRLESGSPELANPWNERRKTVSE
jgi:hypothetical protein